MGMPTAKRKTTSYKRNTRKYSLWPPDYINKGGGRANKSSFKNVETQISRTTYPVVRGHQKMSVSQPKNLWGKGVPPETQHGSQHHKKKEMAQTLKRPNSENQWDNGLGTKHK